MKKALVCFTLMLVLVLGCFIFVFARIDCDHSYGSYIITRCGIYSGPCKQRDVTTYYCKECGEELRSTARYYTVHEGHAIGAYETIGGVQVYVERCSVCLKIMN